MTACDHVYTGSHERGWTCRRCGEHCGHVQYLETAVGQRFLARMQVARHKLDEVTTSAVMDMARTMLALALEAIEQDARTIQDARQIVREMLDEARAGKESRQA